MPEHEPMRQPFERVPQELKAYPQWVNWRLEDDKKVPVNPSTLGNAGVHWENTWTSFQKAAATGHLGIGFVLTEDDPYTCVDLDKCVEPGMEISDETRGILDLLSGWVELSPSGTGLHVWVKNQTIVNRRSPGIEIYSSGRWMTVTGRSNPNAPPTIPERTTEVEELFASYFADHRQEFAVLPVTVEDDEIWERLFRSSNGTFFRSLFQGDTSVCYGDHSRAVILLANQLARMTDLDAGRVKNLLYQTGLIRDKWEEKRGNITWIDYQIKDAIAYMSRRQG